MARLTLKIGGEAGFGIMVSGLTFSKAMSRAGFHIVEINEYPSLIRGGHNVVAVTFSDEEIYAPYKPVDILVALNKQTIELHLQEMNGNGVIIYDNEAYELDPEFKKSTARFCPIPLLKLAKSVGGDTIMRNTVALGAVFAVLKVQFDFLSGVLTEQFKRKGEAVVNQNTGAAKAGYDYINEKFSQTEKSIKAGKTGEKKMVVTGAEAVGLGAIAAGVKFFAAYPMTPINGLLHFMAAVQAKYNFVYKQPEDEISAINMIVGASFAGVRSMTATSGGGFALMVEGTSFAGMVEQPIVIVMGMRPGPATGLPTWTGQADLHFIVNAGHGEYPRLVLCPGDAEEAFYLTAEAFNLADRYQTPVFVLVDKYLCETRFNPPIPFLNKITIDRGKLLSEQEQVSQKEFARYKFTDDGISPRGIPGRKGGVFRDNTDEHNEMGYSEESAENTQKMIDKRMKKQEMASAAAPDPVVYGDKNADITFVGWGSTKGAVLEAMAEIKRVKPEALAKLSFNYLHLNYINPFPSAAVEKILKGARHVIDIEGNHNAQMRDYIRMKTGFHIKDTILKYDGRPFYPEDIINGLKKYV
jgi:2-oxoglutarate/2-oxoacid ferredoxin oxidoreductase subunit alpha